MRPLISSPSRPGPGRDDFWDSCKLHKFSLESLCNLPIDFAPKMWYNIYVKGQGEAHRVPYDAKGSTPYTDECERPLKNFSKNF